MSRYFVLVLSLSCLAANIALSQSDLKHVDVFISGTDGYAGFGFHIGRP